MSSQDTVATALDNLKQIKAGEDPRSPEVIEANKSPLQLAREMADALYEQYPWLAGVLPREQIHVATTYWDRRRGQCLYQKKPVTDKRQFGKRVARKRHFRRASGHYVILVNRAIIEVGDEEGNWKDTVRHEMAHALQREKYGYGVQSHGPEFKECARKLGAKPKASHSMRPEWAKHR